MRDLSSFSHSRSGHQHHDDGEDEDDNDNDNDNDSQGTEVPGEQDDVQDGEDDGVIDEVGAQDAFVAGMIYAMSRRIAPGAPYTPSSGGEDTRATANSSDADRGRWRLDECLRSVLYIYLFLSTNGQFVDAVIQVRNGTCWPKGKTEAMGWSCR